VKSLAHIACVNKPLGKHIFIIMTRLPKLESNNKFVQCILSHIRYLLWEIEGPFLFPSASTVDRRIICVTKYNVDYF